MVVFEIGGKSASQGKSASAFRRRLPEVVCEGLRIIRRWADSAGRKIFLMGWSRGASWAFRIAVTEAALVDGVWACAAYPTTKGVDVQEPPL